MSDEDFPETWIKTHLSEICLINPKVKLEDDLDVGFMPMTDMPKSYFGGTAYEVRKWEKVKKGFTQFKNGDTLFAKITPCFENSKAAIISDFPNKWGAGSTEYYILRPYGQLVDPRLLFALVKTKEFLVNGAANMSGSVGHRRVPKDFVENYTFPLMPFAEQKVIASKLDELLAQVDTIKTRLDAIPAILKRFRQSVLAAAVSGKLTEEWREDNSELEKGEVVFEKWLMERRISFEKEQTKLIAEGKLKQARKFREPIQPDLETEKVEFPSSWATVSVSQFAECLDQIRIPVKKEHRSSAKGLYPYFGANGEVDRVDEYLFDDDLVLVTEDETFYGRVKPIAYRYTGKCWVNNHAHVLRAPTPEANDFLCYALMYYNVIPWLSGTTGRAKLTQAALNGLPIGLPPKKEQVEIVRLVENYVAFTDQIEQQIKSAQTRVNSLTQSILAKAFQGELTAEWRKQNPDLISGDNSSEALLETIKLERDKSKATNKHGSRNKIV